MAMAQTKRPRNKQPPPGALLQGEDVAHGFYGKPGDPAVAKELQELRLRLEREDGRKEGKEEEKKEKREDAAEKRAQSAEDRATAAEKRANEAHELSKSADSRANKALLVTVGTLLVAAANFLYLLFKPVPATTCPPASAVSASSARP